MTAYYCGSTATYVEDHHNDRCLACLKASRDYYKGLAENPVQVQLRTLNRRISAQRTELASKNDEVVGLWAVIWRQRDEIKAAAAVAFGLMGMFEALRSNLWSCSHTHGPDDPEADCDGQNFIPADPDGPWICWRCGRDENWVAQATWAPVPSPSEGEKT